MSPSTKSAAGINAMYEKTLRRLRVLWETPDDPALASTSDFKTI
jgi:hypothetical protein